jgi:hypothetical protein
MAIQLLFLLDNCTRGRLRPIKQTFFCRNYCKQPDGYLRHLKMRSQLNYLNFSWIVIQNAKFN